MTWPGFSTSRSVARWITAFAALSAPALGQIVLRVDAAAPPGGDGQSWGTAFRSLDDALDVAADSAAHQVWVARGTYTHTTYFNLKVGDELYGGFDGTETRLSQRDPALNPTILDGLLDHRVVRSGPDTVVDGFTVQNGQTPFQGAGMRCGGGGRVTIRDVLFLNNTSGDDGGGLSCSSDELLVENCVFRGNAATSAGGQASRGGGARFYDAVAVFESCVFEANFAQDRGGAVSTYDGHATYRRCVFRANSAGNRAGAVYSYQGNPTYERCAFHDNQAASAGAIYNYDGDQTFRQCHFRGNSTLGSGGAIFSYRGTLSLIGSSFVENAAASSGGALRQGGQLELIGCRFTGNSAGLDGGALWVAGPAQPSLVNASFRGNVAGGQGGGVYGTGVSAVLCSFSGNSAPAGGAGWFGGASVLSSSVFAGNSAPQLSADPRVTFSLVEDGYPGTANLDGDPLFQDPAAGDLRLAPGSPCIDAGRTADLPADAFDLDGDGDTDEPLPLDLAGGQRDSGASVDMGALESGLGCGRVEPFCDALPNASGSAATIAFQGSPRLGPASFRLSAHAAVPGATCIFFYGSQETQVPFGNGYRCLADETYRLGIPLTVDGAGAIVSPFTLPAVGPGAVVPGATWSFQLWYSDPLQAGSGFNLSDGVRVRFCS